MASVQGAGYDRRSIPPALETNRCPRSAAASSSLRRARPRSASPRPPGPSTRSRRTRPSHLKLSIAAYSYRDSLLPKGKPPTMDLFGFCDLAADMGLDGVELTSYYFPPDVKPAYFHRLKQYAFNLGLDVSGTSVGNNFCVAPGPERDKQLKLVRTWVDNAAELDAPVIRIFAGIEAEGRHRGRGRRPRDRVHQGVAALRDREGRDASPSRTTAGSWPRPTRCSGWSRRSTRPTSA